MSLPSGFFGIRPDFSPTQIEGLQNVKISSLLNNQILQYNSSSDKWVNATIAGGGNVSTPGLSNTSRLVRVTGANEISESGVSADASDNITGVNDLDVGGNLTVTGTMGGLTAAERTQLANIDTTTISTTQWGYLGGLNQALATSSSPTFAALTVVGDMGGITAAERTQLANIDATTISTTQWGYVGAQDQGTASTDSPTFAALTVVGDMGGITAAERTQLANIDTTTISTTQWGYLGGLNQALATSSSPTFAALTVVGDMGGITAAERTQLANIDATTISTTQWGYVGAQDQGTATTDTPTFTGLSANSQKITDLADPTASTDAVTLNYLDVYHPSTQAKLVSYESSSPFFYTMTTNTKMVWDTDQFPSSSLVSYNNSTGEFTLTTGYLYHITIAGNIQYNTAGGGGSNTGRIQSGAGTICLNRNAGRIGEVDSLAMSAFYDCNGRTGTALVVYYEYTGVGEMYIYKGGSMCITPIRYTQT